MDENIEQKVRDALNDIRPNIQADGGDIEFVGIDQNVVKVKLKGACVGCPMSTMTLKQGVEAYVKKKVPEIVRVESVQ